LCGFGLFLLSWQTICGCIFLIISIDQKKAAPMGRL
jgi:hypothetical protein